jgi:hypothetical protein
MLMKRHRAHLGNVADKRVLPGVKEFMCIVSTFGLSCFGWVFFRSSSVLQAWGIIKTISSPSLFQMPDHFGGVTVPETVFFVLLFVVVEWFGRDQKYAIETLGLSWRRSFRYAMYYGCFLLIIMCGGSDREFIYFQF